MPSAIADAANPDSGPLPDIVVINLSHGNIELVANPTGNRLQHLPFTLERHIFRQSEADLTYANIHMIIENPVLWPRQFLPLIYHPLTGVSNRTWLFRYYLSLTLS